MKINALTFIFTLFFYVSFGQTSEEIIRKNIEISFKGDSKKIISLLLKGRYMTNLVIKGASRPPQQFTEYVKNDGKSKNEIWSNNDVTIICYDGKERIMTYNGKIVEIPDLEIKNESHDTIIKYKDSPKYEFINYLADAWAEGQSSKFELIGKEFIENQECYVLKSDTYLKSQIIYCYISTDKYMLLRLKSAYLTGNRVSETNFEDYREVDGFLLPFANKIYSYQIDNETIKTFTGVKYDEIVINPKIDDSIFDCSKPSKVIIKE